MTVRVYGQEASHSCCYTQQDNPHKHPLTPPTHTYTPIRTSIKGSHCVLLLLVILVQQPTDLCVAAAVGVVAAASRISQQDRQTQSSTLLHTAPPDSTPPRTAQQLRNQQKQLRVQYTTPCPPHTQHPHTNTHLSILLPQRLGLFGGRSPCLAACRLLSHQSILQSVGPICQLTTLIQDTWVFFQIMFCN